MKKIKIGFREQSKAVTAEVDLTYEGTDQTNEEVLEEAKALYEEACKYSKLKSMQKL